MATLDEATLSKKEAFEFLYDTCDIYVHPERLTKKNYVRATRKQEIQ